jgi:hypothetical protein
MAVRTKRAANKAMSSTETDPKSIPVQKHWRQMGSRIGIFALGLSVYLLTLPADLRGNADTLYRFNITKSLVDHLSSHFVCRNPNDPRAVAGLHGCWYTIYAPGQTVAMIPLYEVGKLISYSLGASFDFATALATRMLDPILGALTLVVFFSLCIAIGFRRGPSIALTIVLAFASTLWPDVQSGQDTPQVTLLLLVAVYSLFRAFAPTAAADQTVSLRRPTQGTWVLIAGLCAGLGIVTRYDFAIYAAVLAVYVVVVSVRAQAHATGGSVSRFKYGEVHHATRIKSFALFALGVAPFVLIDAAWNTQRFGAPWKMGQTTSGQFGFPIWQGIPNLLVSPSKGLVWYLPLIWLIPLCAKPFKRRSDRLFWLCTALVGTAVIFYANVIYWHGDPGWGPRYLFPIVPFLVLPIGEILERFHIAGRGVRTTTVAVIGLSLVVQIAAVSVDGWRFWYHLVQVRQQAGQVIQWDYRHYDYYWTSDPSLDPELYQFVAAKDVVQVAIGNQREMIRPAGLDPHLHSGISCKQVTPATPQSYDYCRLAGISPRPLNTVSSMWLNSRYQWYSPGAVPLDETARAAIIIALVFLGGCGAWILVTVIRASDPTDELLPAHSIT